MGVPTATVSEGQTCKAKIYSVVAIFEPAGHQLHARLANDETPCDIITISIPTLNDQRFWKILSPVQMSDHLRSIKPDSAYGVEDQRRRFGLFNIV